nr:hypothetical protein [Alteribacillus persepolensis]
MIQTFLVKKQNTHRFLSAWCLLMMIILFPMEFSVAHWTVKPVFVFLLAAAFFALCSLSLIRKWKVLLLSLSFSFLFAAFRFIEWYEPVVFLFGRFVTYVICFGFIFWLFFSSLRERIICAVIASCCGEIVCQIHLFPFSSAIYLGEIFFLNYIMTLVAVMYGIHLLYKMFSFVNGVVSPSGSNLPG